MTLFRTLRAVALCIAALAAFPLQAGTPPGQGLVVNELDVDQPDTDATEFVEILNTTTAPIDLDPFELVFINGSGGATYDTIQLPAALLAAGDYYVVCANSGLVANCDQDDAPDTNWLQNGNPDAVVLRGTGGGAVVDAVSYRGTVATAVEGTGISATAFDGVAGVSFGRRPNGTDTNLNSADFSVCNTTSGAPNTTCYDISINDIPVPEGNSGTTIAGFKVTASNPLAGNVTFSVATADGSATTADNDYVARSLTGQALAAAATQFDFDVTINGDTTVEPDETFTSAVSAVNGPAVLVDASGTGTITNDDAAVVDVSINDVSQAEGNAGTSTFNFIVQLSQPAPAGGITFDVATTDDTATTADSDYMAFTMNGVTIPQGQQQFAVDVTVNGDTTVEPDEQFFVDLRNVAGTNLGTVDGQGIGTITNDDIVVVGSLLAFNPNTLSQAEGNSPGCATTAFNFTVTATPAPLADLNFAFSTTDGTAVSTIGGAGNPDFTAVTNGTGTVLAGQGSGTATVLANCDTANEPDESFTATLQPGAGYTLAIGGETATGTITNDDVAPLDVTIADVTAAEGNSGTSTFTFTVQLSAAAPAGGATFDVATADSSANAGSDYVGINLPDQTIPEGNESASFAVTVNGDLVNETDETFFFNISDVTATNLGTVDNQAVGTMTNDDQAALTIAQIQGNGITSPSNNVNRTVIGAVVTSVMSNQFSMQTAGAGDGDPMTSDGILVFTGGAPTVVVGDVVDVRGNVVEFPNSGNVALRVTEFSGGPLIVNRMGTASLPPAIVFDSVFPSTNLAAPTCVGAGSTITTTQPADVQNFECFEGMRITTSTGIVTAPNLSFGTDPIAEMFMTTASAAGRAMREPGIRVDIADEVPPTLTPAAPPLPAGGAIWDGNPDVFELDHDKAGLPNTILVPGTRFSATGVLGFEFSDYEFWPVSLTVDQAAPALPVAVPVADANQLTVASLNMLRFFNDVDDPGTYDDCATQGTQDVCPTTVQFNNNVSKRSAYIRTVLRLPMVLGVSEVENLATLTSLANQLNTDLAGAFTYTALMGADDDNDPGHINNGFLVRNDVTVDSTLQFRTTDTFSFNGTVSGLVFDRPPFLLRATTSVGGTPLSFAVIANHLRSLGGIDTQTPASALVDAHRVRQKRLRGAALLATEIQAFQTASPTVPLLVTGDMNAFEFSDGYADINGVIRGDAVPSQSEYNLGFDDVATGTGPDGNIVVPPLVGALSALPPPERYSFIFGGSAQVLDHGFLSRSAVTRFDGFAYGRGNCDAPLGYETDFSAGNLPLRSSDHDAYVIYLDATATPSGEGFVILKDSFEDP
jgi:predicted extracellular nuclease